jgi:outer membrane lipoprotein-sorting protein
MMHVLAVIKKLAGLKQVFQRILLALLLSPMLSQADTLWNLDALMNALANTKSGHAAFVEKKSIAMLDQPVESSGELFYTAPNYLEKRTLKPKKESLVLDKDQLIVEQRGKKRTLSLQSYPEVAAFIDSIRGTLAGDKKALERTYKLALEGDESNWHLTLSPLENKMKKIVQTINISGASNQLHTIIIEQADGDSSHMTITPIDATINAAK